MPPENDAPNFTIAMNNCACCAIGALLGKSAMEIMRRYSHMIGATIQTESSTKAADLFARFLIAKKGGKKGEDSGEGIEALQQQIDGMKLALTMEGFSVVQAGEIGRPLMAKNAVETAAKWNDNTKFLCLTGDVSDWDSHSLVGAPHWTAGIVRKRVPIFIDYQMAITNEQARLDLKRRTPADLTRPGVFDQPMAGFGRPLDPADGRVILIGVFTRRKAIEPLKL